MIPIYRAKLPSIIFAAETVENEIFHSGENSNSCVYRQLFLQKFICKMHGNFPTKYRYFFKEEKQLMFSNESLLSRVEN
jgi:hypothetical protein